MSEPQTEIKAGDVVVLKSGGPRMTVSQIYGDPPKAECTWFDDNKKRCNDEFALNLILKHTI